MCVENSDIIKKFTPSNLIKAIKAVGGPEADPSRFYGCSTYKALRVAKGKIDASKSSDLYSMEEALIILAYNIHEEEGTYQYRLKEDADSNLALMERICNLYGISLTLIKPEDQYCSANGEDIYLESSSCSGPLGEGGNICLGIYENLEFRLLSFFHEMGHLMETLKYDGGFSSYLYESRAWSLGYLLAEAYGITFSDEAKAWGRDQLETYK